MLQASEVKSILRINDLAEEEINIYITRYSRVILAQLGDWAIEAKDILFEDPVFEECLLALIACQLSRTDIGLIHSPSEDTVGNTTEKYNNASMGLYGNIKSWCDTYENLLSSLTNKKADFVNVYAIRRKGMSSTCGWWHI